MGLVSDERTALVIEDETCGLAACWWNWFDTTAFFVDTEDVSIGTDAEKVTVCVFGGAEEGDSQLEKPFIICLLSGDHVSELFLIIIIMVEPLPIWNNPAIEVGPCPNYEYHKT